jgi:uncharacterized membrane protein YfcA
MLLGVPLNELLWLALAIVIAGIVTGLLAGLFGIGGGAVIVPVLYEVFRLLGVPEEVLMQLCVGTSIAIIVPTTIRSYLAHREKGLVVPQVIRLWAAPAVLGVICGAIIAAFAPAAVFKIAFVVIAAFIAIKFLFAGDRWNLGEELPGTVLMSVYGFGIGLAGSLMGVSGGSLSNIVLTLYGKPIHNAVATSAGLGVPITIVGALGYIALVKLDRALRRSARPQNVAPHARNHLRELSAAHIVALCRQLVLSSARLPIAFKHQPVAADLPALQPVEKAHAEQACTQLPGLHHQRLHRTFLEFPHRNAIERDRRGAGAPVRCLDADRIVQQSERQAGGFGIVGRKDDRTGAGVDDHVHPRSVDLGGDREISGAGTRHLGGAAVRDHVAGHQFREDPVGDLMYLVAVGISNHQDKPDHGP